MVLSTFCPRDCSRLCIVFSMITNITLTVAIWKGSLRVYQGYEDSGFLVPESEKLCQNLGLSKGK